MYATVDTVLSISTRGPVRYRGQSRLDVRTRGDGDAGQPEEGGDSGRVLLLRHTPHDQYGKWADRAPAGAASPTRAVGWRKAVPVLSAVPTKPMTTSQDARFNARAETFNPGGFSEGARF